MTKLETAKAFIEHIEDIKKVKRTYIGYDSETKEYREMDYEEDSVSRERLKRQLIEARALLLDVMKEYGFN